MVGDVDHEDNGRHGMSELYEEKGLAIVEATMLLPFCMIMVIALYYAAIFMCQKANLQANLQNALIYYKNVESDTYVETTGDMPYQTGAGTILAAGSGYGEPEYLFPYRFFGVHFDSQGFNTFFRSICGHMFFDEGENVTITSSLKNYVIYKEITATAVQTVKPAISLEMLGIPNEMTISVTATAVVSNGEELVRDVDFVIDIVQDTALGQAAGEMVDKAVDFYERFKKKFNIK